MTDSAARRVAVALDTSDWNEYREWCDWFGPRVGALKVGLEAFVRWGPLAVETARARADRLFLDLKLHDIPNTVAGAVRSAAKLGVDLMTVHAGGGAAMLRSAVRASPARPTILAVTVLTHLDRPALEELGMERSPEALARSWAKMAASCGCGGMVCSPHEAAALRELLPEPFELVTPGIRPGGAVGGDDQRRTATAPEALAAGASLLVIGRPLTRATDRDRALQELLAGC